VPTVVIVGRPNVGKSSLMNRLAGRRISIVDPTAGVTRDRVGCEIEVGGRSIELVDTGGYGIEGFEGDADLTDLIERQIVRGLEEADLVLFVVDAQSGILPLDEQVARLLRQHRGDRPVLLVVNKVDGEAQEADAGEAYALGFGEPRPISALNRRGVDALGEAMLARLPAPGEPASAESKSRDAPRLALVGKRNAGKSTLTNALAGSDRVIVSETAGTTRDSVDVPFELDGRPFIAIDTAGMRKRKSVKQDVEYYSHHRSLRSIRRADVVLFLIDATTPLSQVDNKLATEIARHHKPVIFVINKWDLVDRPDAEQAFADYLDEAFPTLSFAPIAFTDALSGEGMAELIAMADNLRQQASHRVGTGELNRMFESIVAASPPRSRSGKRAKIFYVSQLDVRPPTIGLFVNDPDLFDPTYQRFLLGRLRDEAPYSEVPIKLLIRARRHAPEGAALDEQRVNTRASR